MKTTPHPRRCGVFSCFYLFFSFCPASLLWIFPLPLCHCFQLICLILFSMAQFSAFFRPFNAFCSIFGLLKSEKNSRLLILIWIFQSFFPGAASFKTTGNENMGFLLNFPCKSFTFSKFLCPSVVFTMCESV